MLLQIATYRHMLKMGENVVKNAIFSSPEQRSRRAIVLPPASGLVLALALASTNVKVFRTSLFPNPMMDLVHVWYDDGYWSKILHSTIPTPIRDLKVKVTDLELLSWSFTLKFLGPHYFQTLWWIWFMFGRMINTGLKFYAVPSTHPIHDLTVKVMDLELLC